jgi:hypothetical protein
VGRGGPVDRSELCVPVGCTCVPSRCERCSRTCPIVAFLNGSTGIEAIDARTFREARALLAADACCRLAVLERVEQWDAWSARLPNADDWAAFAMLLLARAAPVVALHGPLRLMSLLNHDGDQVIAG